MQRPLAAIVIVGLLNHTLLPLVVLPILYTLFGASRGGVLTKSQNAATAAFPISGSCLVTLSGAWHPWHSTPLHIPCVSLVRMGL